MKYAFVKSNIFYLFAAYVIIFKGNFFVLLNLLKIIQKFTNKTEKLSEDVFFLKN